MSPALEAAQADTPFQFLLARLFGQFVSATDSKTVVQGYQWRDRLYVVNVVKQGETSEPNSDSQHRGLPDF